MEWDGMGWDEMGWDGMGWDGMGWDVTPLESACVVSCATVCATALLRQSLSDIHHTHTPHLPCECVLQAAEVLRGKGQRIGVENQLGIHVVCVV